MNEKLRQGLLIVGIFAAAAGAIAQVPGGRVTGSASGNTSVAAQLPRPDLQGTVRSQAAATANVAHRAEGGAKQASDRTSHSARKAGHKATKRATDAEASASQSTAVSSSATSQSSPPAASASAAASIEGSAQSTTLSGGAQSRGSTRATANRDRARVNTSESVSAKESATTPR